MLPQRNNSPWIDMLPHPDTLSWFRANQSLHFLLNDACLADKQQIPMLYSLWFDSIRARTHDLPRSEANTLTITPPMRLVRAFSLTMFRQDGTCPNFEVKSKPLYETPILTHIELYPYIATILLTLLTMPASSAAAERSFSAIFAWIFC